MTENQILQCDCRDGFKDVPDCSIDLVATDCPYHIVPGGCKTKNRAMGGVLKGEYAANGKIFAQNDIEFSEWLPDTYRVLKNGCHCYIFCNGRNVARLQQEAEAAGFAFQNLLVWDKGNVTPNRYYMSACEFVLMLKKGAARTINNPGTANVLRVKNPTGRKSHPTEKPVELMRILIENSTNPGDIVLDPFMGSGSTAVACLQTKRRFAGFEIQEDYCRIARERTRAAN